MDWNTSLGPLASAAERRLARLVVSAPSSYGPNRRIDWIHDPMASTLAGKSLTDDLGR